MDEAPQKADLAVVAAEEALAETGEMVMVFASEVVTNNQKPGYTVNGKFIIVRLIALASLNNL